jgi:hypothetical protein
MNRRATVEWYWQRTTEKLGENPVPLPLCPPQIPHGLNRASAVRGRRLTAWATVRPTALHTHIICRMNNRSTRGRSSETAPHLIDINNCRITINQRPKKRLFGNWISVQWFRGRWGRIGGGGGGGTWPQTMSWGLSLAQSQEKWLRQHALNQHYMQ